jgi:hypothetical protein
MITLLIIVDNARPLEVFGIRGQDRPEFFCKKNKNKTRKKFVATLASFCRFSSTAFQL